MSSFQGLYTDFYTPAPYLVIEVNYASKKTDSGHRYVDLPYVKATNENLKGFGRLIDDFDATSVEIKQWPSANKRPVIGGKGAGETDACPFTCEWKENLCFAVNNAVGGHYMVGFKEDGHIYTTDANTHPDGQQIFRSEDGKPFAIVLSKHQNEETLKPTHFVAFYLDGTQGIVINADVYHMVAFPAADDKIQLRTKQGKVHGDVVTDSTVEYGVFMRVPNAFTAPTETELPAHINPPPAPVQIVLSEPDQQEDIPTLTSDFVEKTLEPREATDNAFGPYGKLVTEPSDDSEIELCQWPSKHRPVFLGNEGGTIVCEAVLEWGKGELIASLGLEQEESWASDAGVTFNIKRLLCHPDGSVLFYAKEAQPYLLVVARPTADNKEPEKASLAAFVIPAGKGVNLSPLVWHSPPIPMNAGKLTIRDKCSAVCALHVIHVEEECGNGLQVKKP